MSYWWKLFFFFFFTLHLKVEELYFYFILEKKIKIIYFQREKNVFLENMQFFFLDQESGLTRSYFFIHDIWFDDKWFFLSLCHIPDQLHHRIKKILVWKNLENIPFLKMKNIFVHHVIKLFFFGLKYKKKKVILHK